jgi:hypothetical protein
MVKIINKTRRKVKDNLHRKPFSAAKIQNNDYTGILIDIPNSRRMNIRRKRKLCR